MTDGDFDAVVAFWGTEDDLTALYLAHARCGPELDRILDALALDGGALVDEFAAMRGSFRDAALPDRCYWWTFTPGPGDCLALVLPVYEHGRMVDIVACG